MAENEEPIQVTWVNAETLKITFHEQDMSAVFKKIDTLFGVKIVYERLGVASG